MRASAGGGAGSGDGEGAAHAASTRAMRSHTRRTGVLHLLHDGSRWYSVQRTLNSGQGELAADHGACVEVVQALGAAQRVDVDMAFFVAGVAVGPAFVEQRLEAQFIAGGFGGGVHG